MSYATLAELKSLIGDKGTDWDTRLQDVLDAATSAIDTACGTTGSPFNPVPAPVKYACMLQASRWFKRKDAPFGISGSPEMQGEMRLLAKLDPDVEVLLDSVDYLAAGSQTHRSRFGTAW